MTLYLNLDLKQLKIQFIMIILKENSIFIADTHYNKERTILFDILTKIKSKDISTPQIFLMGDMFDFLAYETEYFKNINSQVISLINILSNDIDIIYFEGNHDFNLINIFPNVKVISRQKQPLNIIHNNKNISLSHGDIFTPKLYNIYSSIIRNHFVLKFLDFIDIDNWLSCKVEKNLKEKKICHEQNSFNEFIENRVKKYNTDLIIEGHFHQGHISNSYINIPSLACDNRYMIYQNNQFKFNTL